MVLALRSPYTIYAVCWEFVHCLGKGASSEIGQKRAFMSQHILPGFEPTPTSTAAGHPRAHMAVREEGCRSSDQPFINRFDVHASHDCQYGKLADPGAGDKLFIEALLAFPIVSAQLHL